MPVKHLLQPGSNNLSIQIHSAGAFAERQAAAYPYDVVRHGLTDRDAGTAYRRLVEQNSCWNFAMHLPCLHGRRDAGGIEALSLASSQHVSQLPSGMQPGPMLKAPDHSCARCSLPSSSQTLLGASSTTSSASQGPTSAGTGAPALLPRASMGVCGCMPTATHSSQARPPR